MATAASKLVPYVPKAYPAIPDAVPQFVNGELRNIAQSIKSADEVMAVVENNANGIFLQIGNNLSDVADAPTARTNLGLDTAAVEPVAFFLQTANNLSDIPVAATARTNLGLGTSAVEPVAFFLQTANNLSDVTAATARSNIVAATKTQTDFISGVVSTPQNKDYRIIESIPYGATITGFTAKLLSGSLTATLNINATAITGGALSVSSTQSSTTPTGADTMVVTDALVLTLSSVSSPTDLSFTVTYTRTLA